MTAVLTWIGKWIVAAMLFLVICFGIVAAIFIDDMVLNEKRCGK